MRAVCVLALGAAALMSTSASAQVISRSVSEEPVETIVTQTPNGMIVTRRPVGSAAAPVPYAAPPVVVETETVPQTVDAITTREVVRRVETRPLVSRGVALTTQTTRIRKSGKLVQTRAPREVVTRTVMLSSAERHIVYQTIVEREVVPAAPQVIVPAPVYGAPAVATEPVYAPPVVAQDEDVVAPAPAYGYPAYAVGSVLPANVPLYAVPDEVAYRVPSARPYSYAYLGGRAYLVDPATSVIVADVTE